VARRPEAASREKKKPAAAGIKRFFSLKCLDFFLTGNCFLTYPYPYHLSFVFVTKIRISDVSTRIEKKGLALLRLTFAL